MQNSTLGDCARRVSKTGLLVGVLVVAALICAWLVSESHWARLNSPDGKFSSASEYIASGRLPSRVNKFQKDNKTFFVAYSPMDCGLALPSGPAAYVFDDTGKMVDWSRDTGDDSEFQRKWPASEQRASSLDEFRKALAP